jgi:hypothetical protein
MIKIEHMTVRIPASLRARAAPLVRLMARHLAAASQAGDRRIDVLKVSLTSMRPEMPVGATARRMSEAIQDRSHRGPGGKS